MLPLLQPLSHCFSAELSFLATGGHSRSQELLWRQVPQAVSHYRAGSHGEHEAIPPDLAGVPFWPVHWPFCRLRPQAYRSPCPFPLTFHPPGQGQVSPPARRKSVLSCHSSRSTQFGFIIKPFSWRLLKALIATSTSCVPWLPGLAGPERGPSFPHQSPSPVQVSLPSLAYLSLL